MREIASPAGPLSCPTSTVQCGKGEAVITAIQPRLLKIPEACLMLGISRSKLYDLLGRDAIRAVRLDRAARIPVSEVDRYLAAQYAAQGIDVAPTDDAAA